MAFNFLSCCTFLSPSMRPCAARSSARFLDAISSRARKLSSSARDRACAAFRAAFLTFISSILAVSSSSDSLAFLTPPVPERSPRTACTVGTAGPVGAPAGGLSPAGGGAVSAVAPSAGAAGVLSGLLAPSLPPAFLPLPPFLESASPVGGGVARTRGPEWPLVAGPPPLPRVRRGPLGASGGGACIDALFPGACSARRRGRGRGMLPLRWRGVVRVVVSEQGVRGLLGRRLDGRVVLLDGRLVDRHEVVVEEVVGRARLGELVGGRGVRRGLGWGVGRGLGGLPVWSAIECSSPDDLRWKG